MCAYMCMYVNNVARSLSNQGKFAEAEEMGREVLAVRKRVLGAEHHYTPIRSYSPAVG